MAHLSDPGCRHAAHCPLLSPETSKMEFLLLNVLQIEKEKWKKFNEILQFKK